MFLASGFWLHKPNTRNTDTEIKHHKHLTLAIKQQKYPRPETKHHKHFEPETNQLDLELETKYWQHLAPGNKDRKYLN